MLSGIVVALAAWLGSAVPVGIGSTGDAAVREAVTRAGPDARIVVTAPFEPEDPASRTRVPTTAALVAQDAELARFRLGPALQAVLAPPVAAVTSVPLTLTDDGPDRTLRLAYLAGARVTWTAGGPPRASVADPDAQVPPGSGPWPVQVGLSEATAAALDLRPGQRVPVRDPRGGDLDVRVSGVFRALDPADPGWRTAPLLRPAATAGIAAAALMSADSLPDGRLALAPDDVRTTIAFTPRPDALRAGNAASIAAAVVALEAGSATGERWDGDLDGVLRGVRAEVDAATARAELLLAGLVVTAALVLVLAADVLVRRRAPVLALLRLRGAGLPGLGARLAAESTAVAAGAAVLGVAGARLRDGSASWPGPLLVAAVAALAPPVLGVRAAAGTTPRRTPANRSARRAVQLTAGLRRGTAELAAVLLAAAALVALRQRGAVDGGLLAAAAPILTAAVAGLALVRLLPPAAALARSRAARSPAALPVLQAARVTATAQRPLPPVVLVTASALLAIATTVARSVTAAPGPLDEGLRRLAVVTAAAALVLGALGVLLGAAAGAPDRAVTLARLRALGLPPRRAVLVAAGELLPPVVAGAALGAATGWLLTRAVLGGLGLAGTAPPAVLALAPAFPAVALAAVLAERRRAPAEVLRAG